MLNTFEARRASHNSLMEDDGEGDNSLVMDEVGQKILIQSVEIEKGGISYQHQSLGELERLKNNQKHKFRNDDMQDAVKFVESNENVGDEDERESKKIRNPLQLIRRESTQTSHLRGKTFSQTSSRRQTFTNFPAQIFSPSSINNMVGNDRPQFFRNHEETQNSLLNQSILEDEESK